MNVILENLSQSYRDFKLGPIDATIPQGVTALLGANGAGKTTMMQLIVGIRRPKSGQVVLPARVGPVGFLPQSFVGPPRPTVVDYLTYVAWCRSTRQLKINATDVARALEAVGLADRAQSRIGTLSGGMVRRLGLAQALLGTAKVLVLDEPTVGLDPIQRHEVRELISQLGEHAVVLMSTHLAEDVASIAEHVIVLDAGRALFEGEIGELCGDSAVTSEAVETGFLGIVKELASQR